MAASTSIAAQLQAIKSFVKADAEPLKKPFTRPSILYDPKEAADTDLDKIYEIALTGLESLVNVNERFRAYKSDLFSHQSKEVNRELMNIEENNRINLTITSYLRLISGYLASDAASLHPALKTLEYLIRRYKIHVYNMEELILCAIPYHQSHAFVRIVQLMDFGNTKWKFLDGVKVSGALPPREVIVQQCIRDFGVLESLLSYATPTKKNQQSQPVTSFCIVVAYAVLLSSATIDNDLLKRILPFVAGIRSGAKGISNHKVGVLMIVGAMAKRAALSEKLVKSLLILISELAEEAESTDLQWFQMSMMTLINLVQLQSVPLLPKKVLDSMIRFRDLSQIISRLAGKFNIEKFLRVFISSLIHYSDSDDLHKTALISVLKDSPLKGIIQYAVSRFLSKCLRLAQNVDSSELPHSGTWAKQVLFVIKEKYPEEFCSAFHRFMEDAKVPSGENLVFDRLCRMLDGSSSAEISDSKIWFSLEHPKAEIRCTMLHSLDTSKVLDGDAVNYQRFSSIQDAVLRRLYDADLDVLKAALSLDRLSELIGSIKLLEVLQDVLKRCTSILLTGTSKDSNKARDICLSCLELAATEFDNKEDYIEKLATVVFPFLLVFPKTKKLNLKVQAMVGNIMWPLYSKLCFSEKGSGQDSYLINTHTIHSLAEVYSGRPEEHLPWLVKCSDNNELSKTISLLIILQSCVLLKNDARIFNLFEASFSFLQKEWIALEQYGDLISDEEIKTATLDGSCIKLLDQLRFSSHGQLNAIIIRCTFWNLITSYLSALPTNTSWVDDNGEWFCKLSELYVFFAERKFKNLFMEHLQHIVLNLKVSPVTFFSRFITRGGFSSGAQATSLHSLTALCSTADESLAVQLFHEFPSVIVPLSSEAQDVRAAAMDFVEGLFALWSRIQSLGKRNGNNESWSSSVDGLLRLLVQQKKLLTSDRNFLVSLFGSVLSPSSQGLVESEERFDKSTMNGILGFILGCAMKLPEYAKLKILLIFKDAGSSMMSVKDVQCLLSDLLLRLQSFHFGSNTSCQKLSNTDVDILCLLLEICCTKSSGDLHHVQDNLLAALQVDHVSASDPAILRPCTTILLNLNDCFVSSLTSEKQEILLNKLVILHHSQNNFVQNAAKDALLRLTITSSTVIRMLESIDLSGYNSILTPQQVRKKSKTRYTEKSDNVSGQTSPGFVSSLLDVILLKKDIMNRATLAKPLFHLLRRVNSDVDKEQWVQASSGTSQSNDSPICDIQQTILLVLEDIACSISCDILQNDCLICDSDIKLLVDYASSCKVVGILNQALSLFSMVTKIIPRVALPYIADILSVSCKSILFQEDKNSKTVFENLISAVVPCWLSNGKDTSSLLQIFIEVMGDLAQHRRLTVILHILRTMGEQQSLGSCFLLLVRSVVNRKKSSPPHDKELISKYIISELQTEWEYKFALQICEQYSTTTWLPSLVLLLKLVQSGDGCQQFTELLYSSKFVQERLLDPEVVFKLDCVDGSDTVQGTLGELVEQVVYCLVLVDRTRDRSILPAPLKKELKVLLHDLLISMTKKMIPSTLFRVTSIFMGHADRNVTKKALRLLCETVRESSAVKSSRGKQSKIYQNNAWVKLDAGALDNLVTLGSEILQKVDQPHVDELDQSLKLAAVSAVEVLASKFPPNHSISNKCLSSVVKNILSDDLSVASSCLRTTGAFINILGSRALPELPGIMANILERSRGLHLPTTDTGTADLKEKVMLSLLVTLEALVEKLGSFLNPYLSNVLQLLVLNPSCTSDSDHKLNTKAEVVRQLFGEHIPVRLALPPLLKLYPEAVKAGDLSLRILFQMLTSFVIRMDKASVSSYHGEIFNMLLLALDLRCQHRPEIKRIHVVEEYVSNTMVALTMKLTETMFKPLFIRCIEWVESTTEENEHSVKIDRAIAFYHLINKLVENHRSLFVPYFKFLLKGCVEYLSEDGKSGAHSRKKKKAKLDKVEVENVDSDALALQKWHLRALVLSSLHKCFLYDTGKQMFLDSTNFQELVKPIVSQMVSVPPLSLEEESDVPSEKEVDDILVSCVGQMAVAAGSDLLWKPLNYEVLMQTRGEAVRACILGLRIVKSFMENLKEEYMVLLAETIPFLVELLENSELSVKTLAQDTIKELELMSGENLRDYF